MKHLILVSDAWNPQVNGVVRTLENTIKQLKQRRWNITTVTPDKFKTLRVPFYPEIPLSLPPYDLERFFLPNYIPNAVHIATEGPLGIIVRRYCIKHDIPFTTAYHTQFPLYLKKMCYVPENWTYSALKRFHNAAETCMVPSQSIKKLLSKKGFNNVELWGRGVDSTFGLYNQPHATISELPKPIWLSVGRISAEKNLEAFLNLELPGTKVVIGDGPEKERLVREYPDAVFFASMFGKELAEAYRAADVFVFPSKSDTFGLVMAEAITSGIPVAAYPVTGPIDVVVHKNTGWLSDDLRDACFMALTIDKSKMESNFSWEDSTDQFEKNLKIL